jgi:hypothetical protein
LLTREEFERRGPRVGGDQGVDVGRAVAAVLGAIESIDPVVDAGVGLLGEGDVLVDAAGADAAIAAVQGVAVPGAALASVGADVQVVAVADDPDRCRLPQRAVSSRRRDLQLVGRLDPAELIARPSRHLSASFFCVSRPFSVL